MGGGVSLLLCWTHLLLLCVTKTSANQLPHVIFIIADDLGWDEVSFRGSLEVPTPNIDTLAYDGIILNNYYVQEVCSPSRASALTGRMPIHTGLQEDVIRVGQPYGLGLEEKLMSEYVKELGYATHLVGKWHLGSFAEQYLPMNRGFDSFYGYNNGHMDYWDQTTRYIPLFLLLAHQAIHQASPPGLYQAPLRHLKSMSHIGNINSRLQAGMIGALDESIGKVVKTLAAAGMLNNSIIVFTTDNGAPIDPSTPASNWPLRGGKEALWEGGTRGNAFIWSELLQRSDYVSNHLMHISDWLPTLLRPTTYDMASLPHDLDGNDLWDALSTNTDASPRQVV